jgi:uncharacterized protein DUF4169
MGDVVNLNKFRKSRMKKSDKETARENIIKHGMSKTEKNRQKKIKSRKLNLLDQKKLNDNNSDDEKS